MTKTNGNKKKSSSTTRKVNNKNAHNTSRETQRTGIVIAIILMAVGFAAVTTTLTINGTIKYGFDSSKFDVIFSSATLEPAHGEEVANDPQIGDSGHSITFTTTDLKTEKETSVLSFTVKNTSTQYDASVNITCKEVGEDGSSDPETALVGKYITLAEDFGKTPVTIAANNGTHDGTLTVTLTKAAVNSMSTKVKCTLEATPVEKAGE